jgi:hypothetical protein
MTSRRKSVFLCAPYRDTASAGCVIPGSNEPMRLDASGVENHTRRAAESSLLMPRMGANLDVARINLALENLGTYLAYLLLSTFGSRTFANSILF